MTAPLAYVVEAGEFTLSTTGRKVRGVIVEYPLGRPPDAVLNAMLDKVPVVIKRAALSKVEGGSHG